MNLKMEQQKMGDLIDSIIEDIIDQYLKDDAIAYPLTNKEKSMLRKDIIEMFEKHDRMYKNEVNNRRDQLSQSICKGCIFIKDN